MSQNNSLITIAVLALIIGLLGGYWGYSVTQEKSAPKQCPSKKVIRQEFVNELRDKGAIPSVPDSIKQTRGEIAEVKKNAIVIETNVPTFDLLQKHLKPTLTAKIAEDTELFKLAKEGEEASGTYEKKEIEKSELKKGQQVTVNSDQDFKGKTELKAKSIRVDSSE